MATLSESSCLPQMHFQGPHVLPFSLGSDAAHLLDLPHLSSAAEVLK